MPHGRLRRYTEGRGTLFRISSNPLPNELKYYCVNNTNYKRNDMQRQDFFIVFKDFIYYRIAFILFGIQFIKYP